MEDMARTESRIAKKKESSSLHSRNCCSRQLVALGEQNWKHSDPGPKSGVSREVRLNLQMEVVLMPREVRVSLGAQKRRMVLFWRNSGKLNL